MLAILDNDLGPNDFSSPRGHTLAPIQEGQDPPELTLEHGPRVFISLVPPTGIFARDLMVELRANPSRLSSQMGGLGGMAPLHEDERGLWAWAPEITNSVRGNGGQARVVSRDGLWASPWKPFKTLTESGEPRPVSNTEEVHIDANLEPRAVLHIQTDAAPVKNQLLVQRLAPSDTPRPSFTSTEKHHYTYRWLPPGKWQLAETCEPKTITAIASKVQTIQVQIQPAEK